MAQHVKRAGLLTLADLATPMAVRVAATLRIADHIAAGRTTAAEIADAAGAHADALDRMLRHLVTVDLFTRDEDGRYGLTAFGEQLRDDHPAGKRQWLTADGAVGRGDLSFVELAHSVRTGQASYPVRYGLSFWDDLGSDPVLSASFDALMSRHIERDNSAIADAYDWAALGHVVDVGGGDGSLLARLLTAHHELRGTVVDLPGPASKARELLRGRGLLGRADVTSGSFFDPLPVGAGGYVLSAIIHDWDDEPAVKILRQCADAAGENGVVLVIEAIGSDGESPDTVMDLRMLACAGGKERGLAELRDIAGQAGLTVRGVHPVGHPSVTSIIELIRE